MAEIGRNINKAFDAGYAASFHFGLSQYQNPYKAEASRRAWVNGWLKARKDKIAALGRTHQTG